MNKSNIKTLEQLNIVLDVNKTDIFDKYVRIFLQKNSHINLISKNDEKILFEKHIFDSLAINLFFKLSNTPHPSPLPQGARVKKLLDIGTGGGFPAIPIAILYENLNVSPLDSTRKKINVIEEIKSELGLKNLFPICERAENIRETYDYVTTRAVAPLKIILQYAIPKLKKGGYFIAYKSKNVQEELKEAQKTIKSLRVELFDIIEYTLPLDEIYERNLIIFRK